MLCRSNLLLFFREEISLFELINYEAGALVRKVLISREEGGDPIIVANGVCF